MSDQEEKLETTDKWYEGIDIPFTFPLAVGVETMLLNVDWVGPKGAQLRGIKGWLKVGDPIRRVLGAKDGAGGRLIEIGVVTEVVTDVEYNNPYPYVGVHLYPTFKFVDSVDESSTH